MAIRKLKNGGRRKAIFGSEEAAILAAAGINVAGTMAASTINANATKRAAQDQANATIQSAQKQAQAIKDQSDKSKEYQEQSQEFIKEQNEQNRELQRDIQLQLQMLTGQQNVNDRLEASKIQVKNGGSTKRKLRLAGQSQFLLQGSENMPFVVTDGGAVIPIGQTPEGYDIYEILGNDHEHYHKSRGGKHKTGVGIKFADGNIIEGEGNQNSNQGELMVNTPDNAYFISKHSIAGFNPTKMTLGGMHPLQAYIIQEQLKAANGISDDGKHNSSPVEKKLLGGQPNPLYTMYNQVGPQVGVDTAGDTSVGVVSNFKNARSLKCGGKTRNKAFLGEDLFNLWWKNNYGNINPYANRDAAQKAIPAGSTTTVPASSDVASFANGKAVANTSHYNPLDVTPTTQSGGTNIKYGSSGFGNWVMRNADLVGAGIGALGNVGGALISSAANRSASKTLAGAYNQAADILANAYRNLKTVDLNSIRREDYSAAHVMPALQAPVSQASGQIALANRALHRRLENAGKYSASGAAAQDRMTRAEIDAQDIRNSIYSQDQAQMQQIRQANAQRVTEAAMKNAELDTAANQQYTSAYLDMLQYNNDIENQKILGSAGALSEGAVNSAGTLANAQTTNANTWASALLGSSQGFANSLSSMATRKADLEAALLGATGDSKAIYYGTLSSKRDAMAQYNALKTQRDAALKAGDTDTAKLLARQINAIASRRGLKLV